MKEKKRVDNLHALYKRTGLMNRSMRGIIDIKNRLRRLSSKQLKLDRNIVKFISQIISRHGLFLCDVIELKRELKELAKILSSDKFAEVTVVTNNKIKRCLASVGFSSNDLNIDGLYSFVLKILGGDHKDAVNLISIINRRLKGD